MIAIEKISAAILCGGKGSRLAGSLPQDLPKALAPIRNQPFLEYFVRKIFSWNLKKVILCTGHLSESLERFKEKNPFSERIEISRESKPLGTGGAIQYALSKLSDPFFVFNGDSYCEVHLQEFMRFHENKKSDLSVVLSKAQDLRSYGSIVLKGDRIIDFVEKPSDPEGSRTGIINAGVYLFSKKLFPYQKDSFSLETDFIPKRIQENWRVFGFKVDSKVKDIGTPQRLQRSQKELFI